MQHMRLELRQTFALELVQRHEQQGIHADSVLPETAEALESGEYDDVLRMVRDLDVLGQDVEWRSVTDWWLCLLLPSERDGCMLFYRDRGPSLKDLHPATTVLLMDAFLLRQLEAMQAGLELEEAMRPEPD